MASKGKEEIFCLFEVVLNLITTETGIELPRSCSNFLKNIYKLKVCLFYLHGWESFVIHKKVKLLQSDRKKYMYAI